MIYLCVCVCIYAYRSKNGRGRKSNTVRNNNEVVRNPSGENCGINHSDNNILRDGGRRDGRDRTRSQSLLSLSLTRRVRRTRIGRDHRKGVYTHYRWSDVSTAAAVHEVGLPSQVASRRRVGFTSPSTYVTM